MSMTLTREEERTLIAQAQAGDIAARDKLVAANQGLIMMLARRILPTATVDHDDLMQAGNIGMLRAIRNFDLSQKTRFSTFAGCAAYNAMKSLKMTQGGSMSLPSSFTAAAWRGEGECGRAKMAAKQRWASLDDSYQGEVFQDLEEVFDAQDLRRFVDRLDERLHVIVNLRMHGLTLKEIGRQFGVTRERVRQLEKQAHRALRAMMEGNVNEKPKSEYSCVSA